MFNKGKKIIVIIFIIISGISLSSVLTGEICIQKSENSFNKYEVVLGKASVKVGEGYTTEGIYYEVFKPIFDKNWYNELKLQAKPSKYAM